VALARRDAAGTGRMGAHYIVPTPLPTLPAMGRSIPLRMCLGGRRSAEAHRDGRRRLAPIRVSAWRA